MLIEALRERVNAFFGRVLQRHRSRLPFKGAVIERVRDLILANLDGFKGTVEDMFTPGGDFKHGVGVIRWYAKTFLKAPLWVRLFVDTDRIIDEVCDELIANAPAYRKEIGEIIPPQGGSGTGRPSK